MVLNCPKKAFCGKLKPLEINIFYHITMDFHIEWNRTKIEGSGTNKNPQIYIVQINLVE